MSKAQDKEKPMRVIYVGAMVLENKSLGFGLLPTLIDGGPTADTMLDAASAFMLRSNRSKPGVIGGVYEVDGIVDDGRLVRIVGNLKFTGDRIEPKVAAVLKLRDSTVRVADRVRKTEAAEARKDALADFLKPLRMRYGSTDRIGKLAFEVLVLDALRRPL